MKRRMMERLPDGLYKALKARAKEAGVKPRSLAAACLAALLGAIEREKQEAIMRIGEEDLVELAQLADKAENLVKNSALFLGKGDWIGWTPGGRLQTARKLAQQAHEDIWRLLEQMKKLEKGNDED